MEDVVLLKIYDQHVIKLQIGAPTIGHLQEKIEREWGIAAADQDLDIDCTRVDDAALAESIRSRTPISLQPGRIQSLPRGLQLDEIKPLLQRERCWGRLEGAARTICALEAREAALKQREAVLEVREAEFNKRHADEIEAREFWSAVGEAAPTTAALPGACGKTDPIEDGPAVTGEATCISASAELAVPEVAHLWAVPDTSPKVELQSSEGLCAYEGGSSTDKGADAGDGLPKAPPVAVPGGDTSASAVALTEPAGPVFPAESTFSNHLCVQQSEVSTQDGAGGLPEDVDSGPRWPGQYLSKQHWGHAPAELLGKLKAAYRPYKKALDACRRSQREHDPAAKVRELEDALKQQLTAGEKIFQEIEEAVAARVSSLISTARTNADLIEKVRNRALQAVRESIRSGKKAESALKVQEMAVRMSSTAVAQLAGAVPKKKEDEEVDRRPLCEGAVAPVTRLADTGAKTSRFLGASENASGEHREKGYAGISGRVAEAPSGQKPASTQDWFQVELVRPHAEGRRHEPVRARIRREHLEFLSAAGDAAAMPASGPRLAEAPLPPAEEDAAMLPHAEARTGAVLSADGAEGVDAPVAVPTAAGTDDAVRPRHARKRVTAADGHDAALITKQEGHLKRRRRNADTTAAACSAPAASTAANEGEEPVPPSPTADGAPGAVAAATLTSDAWLEAARANSETDLP